MSYRDIIKSGKIKPKRGEGGGAGMYPKYTPEEFEQLVDGYIDECAKSEIPTIPVINHFAMTVRLSREQLYKYYREHDDYKDAYAELTQARDGMTEYYLVNPDETRRGASIIFAAKNYLNMTDKQEVVSTNVDMTHEEWLDTLK